MKVQHLEMIQGIINRMAGNSFALKGWAVTLIAGILVLADKDTDKIYIFIAVVPVLFFWVLDSYYLLQERLFRALYKKVQAMDEGKVDFSMDISPKEFHTGENTFICYLKSATEFWFYMPLAVVTVVIIIAAYF